jgi:hypothetical protein
MALTLTNLTLQDRQNASFIVPSSNTSVTAQIISNTDGSNLTNKDVNGNILVTLGTTLSAILGGVINDTIGVTPFRSTIAFEASVQTANATSAVLVLAATLGKSIYITDIVISTDTLGWILLQDNAETPNIIIGKKYFTANSIWGRSYETPKQVIANNQLNVLAQNSGNISIDVNGYII